jgi:hypothetical protein
VHEAVLDHCGLRVQAHDLVRLRPVAGDGVEAFDRLDLVVPPPISGRSFLNCRQRSFRSAMLSNRPPQR